MDQIPLSNLMLPGHLLDFTHKGDRRADHRRGLRGGRRGSREQRVGPGKALVCWTGVDKVWGRPDMNRLRPYIPAESAIWMAKREVPLFATDLIGMDNPDEWWEPTHLAWLSNGDLHGAAALPSRPTRRQVNSFFVAFPIKAVGSTGCPVRAAALVL